MFQVKRLVPHAIIPQRATEGSAGLDVSASEDIIIPAKKWVAVPTGLAMSVPKDCYVRVAPRSGLAFKKGIQTGAGVIDSDYTGSVNVILFNHGDSDFEIKCGDRIAQLIFEKIYTDEFVEVEELGETARGDGGFGSTGIN
jgi:deoxyuridine 5'-triphosphate nucleotidohydrolase